MTPAKKTKVQAIEVGVGKRTLEGVLIDLAEQLKANDERCANRMASIEERSARAEEMSARAEEMSARAEERSARAEERSARAEEMAALALNTIAAVSQDLRALTQEMRATNLRHDARFGALEKTAGA